MKRRPILVYDLNDEGCERACIATRNARTAEPCPHGATRHCTHAIERYVFDPVPPDPDEEPPQGPEADGMNPKQEARSRS
jgi:hypothetical protein